MDELQRKVITAVNLFTKKDFDLLDLWAHEQAMSHRIAVYLEEQFNEIELNVDCEYNKHLRESKKTYIDIQQDQFTHPDCESCRTIHESGVNFLSEKDFRPDIIVHTRRNDANNKIVIEVKKKQHCPFDIAKLRALSSKHGDYGYDLGVSLCFPGRKPDYRWFANGQEVILSSLS